MKYVIIVLLLATPASAQTLTDPKARQTAHVISWVSVLSAEALDVLTSLRSENVKRALVLQAVRVGVVEGAVFGLKALHPEARPCTPAHACGSDGEMTGFPSGHMALACSTLGGPSLGITIPLSVITGAGRSLAWRHFVTKQILPGCGIGLLASRIR